MEYIISQWALDIIDYFWDKRHDVLEGFRFEYPDYFGLPDSIVDYMSEEVDDIIKNSLVGCLEVCKTKKQFAREFINIISNGVIKTL